jgi:hypothetical protein
MSHLTARCGCLTLFTRPFAPKSRPNTGAASRVKDPGLADVLRCLRSETGAPALDYPTSWVAAAGDLLSAALDELQLRVKHTPGKADLPICDKWRARLARSYSAERLTSVVAQKRRVAPI